MSRLLAFIALAIIISAGALAPGWALIGVASAQTANSPSGLAVPRFEAIDSSRVRMRQGPSRNHRVLWVFQGQQGLPLEVVAETEEWRQVRDPDGDLGWVHRSLLGRNRGVVVVGNMRALRREPARDATTIAYLEPRVVADLNECNADWCEISVGGHTGWLRHEEVWGVYSGEVVQ